MDQRTKTQIMGAASTLSMKARAARSSPYLDEADKSLLKRVSAAVQEAKDKPDTALQALHGPIAELAELQMKAQVAVRDSTADERGDASGRLEALTGVLLDAKPLVASLVDHGQTVEEEDTSSSDEAGGGGSEGDGASVPGDASEQPAA